MTEREVELIVSRKAAEKLIHLLDMHATTLAAERLLGEEVDHPLEGFEVDELMELIEKAVKETVDEYLQCSNS